MSHFLQDMQVGQEIDLGRFTFTADHIKRFAALYDPQPFHMDEDAAKQSHFGALCASGWQTASIWMRLYVLHSQKEAGKLEQQGQPVAQMGPGLGAKNLRWLKPVYAGDTLHYFTTVTAKRPSESRPGWGLVSARNYATNQDGVLVFECETTAFLQRRVDGHSA